VNPRRDDSSRPRTPGAALLWGDIGEPQARAALRHTLFTLRKALADTTALRIEGETVGLDRDAVETDVHDFEQCVARGGLVDLERAVALYRGDVLEGLVLEEPSFEEWLIAERLRLRELALDAFARLLARQRPQGVEGRDARGRPDARSDLV